MSWAKFAEGFGSGAGESLGGRLLGPWVDEFNAKALGIPSPNKPGAQELAAMDRMFPGTNPWERLGAGGGGQAASATAHNAARRNADAAAGVQSRQISVNRKNVTDTIDKDKEVARIQAGAAERQSEAAEAAALAAQGFWKNPGGSIVPLRDANGVPSPVLGAAIDRNRAGAQRDRAAAALDTARVDYERIRTNTDVKRMLSQTRLWSAQEKQAFAHAALAGDQAAVQRALARLESARADRSGDIIDAEISRSITNLVTAADDFPGEIAGWLTVLGLGWMLKDYMKPQNREARANERQRRRERAANQRAERANFARANRAHGFSPGHPGYFWGARSPAYRRWYQGTRYFQKWWRTFRSGQRNIRFRAR